MSSSSPPDSPSVTVEMGRQQNNQQVSMSIDFERDRFPFCLVWTPIPVLTWFFPFIGHLGIAMSNGVIRDFAGPYFVSTDNMGFGRPCRYLQLSPQKVRGGVTEYDEAVAKASVTYGTRMHNLFCDNCHSHVGLALALMKYNDSTRYNMVYLAAWVFFRAKYVSVWGFIKTWLPFCIVASVCTFVGYYLS
uniref:CSON005439 protein n=1 Tax=Culicoides sonorensis TaxID=179676 RepID=A0A336L8Q7_CULSO